MNEKADFKLNKYRDKSVDLTRSVFIMAGLMLSHHKRPRTSVFVRVISPATKMELCMKNMIGARDGKGGGKKLY